MQRVVIAVALSLALSACGGEGRPADAGPADAGLIPCTTEGAFSCELGSSGRGVECVGGFWRAFIDGPCSPVADAGVPPDSAP